MKIKYGFHVLTWTNVMSSQALKYLPKLKEMGFDGIEIPLVAKDLDLIEPGYIRRKLNEHKMECVTGTGFGNDLNIISNDIGIAERGIRFLKKCIEITKELGAKKMTGALLVIGKNLIY